MEFLIFTLISIAITILIIWITLKHRVNNPVNSVKSITLLIILETICMVIAKYGANWGLPWWIYYTLPMILTLFFPMIYFRMNKKESITYFLLAIVSAPVIHVLSSLLGWKNYMPFIRIPSLMEMIN